MGTSINQRSPATPNWRAVGAVYSNESVPIERAVQEIWRAATNQKEGNLARDLAAPLIADCLRVAIEAPSREIAALNAARLVASSGSTSLAADIAQRAVVQSFRADGDRETAFVKALFADAGNYLVSRDLPGYVGPNGRVKTVSEAIVFKSKIKEQIAERVAAVRRSTRNMTDSVSWSTYVTDVVRTLRGG